MENNEKIPRFVTDRRYRNTEAADKLKGLFECRYGIRGVDDQAIVKYEKFLNTVFQKLDNILYEYIKEYLKLELDWVKPGLRVVRIVNGIPKTKRALFKQKMQRILISSDFLKEAKPVEIVKTLLHELIHASTIHVLRDEGDGKFSFKKSSVSTESYRKKKRFGVGLEEALTEELVKRIYRDKLDKLPIKDEEKRFIKSKKFHRQREWIFNKSNRLRGQVLGLDDIYYLEHGRFVATFSYTEQRRVLRFVVQKIFKANKERFANIDDVYTLFIRNMFEYDFSVLAKIIERSIGKGAFKILMQMDNSPESAKDTLSELKKCVENQESGEAK